MAKLTPQEFADKHARRLSGATQEIQAGVQRVTESPGARAAAKFDKWQAGISDPANQQKWRARVGAVTLEQWKSKMLTTGVPRIASGIEANKDKVAAFAAEFLPHLDAGVEKVRRMPDTTLDSRVQRAVAMMMHNAQFRRSGQGR